MSNTIIIMGLSFDDNLTDEEVEIKASKIAKEYDCEVFVDWVERNNY